MIEIKNDQYYVDGVPCKHRVSTILKVTKQCDDYSNVDPYYRDLGTYSALAIQLFINGTLDEDSLDPAVTPRVDAWKAFVSQEGYEVIHNELALYSSKEDVCGTLDHYGRLNGKLGIIDTKCSKEFKKWWKKQLHFYKRLFEENKLGEVEFLASLRLLGDGTYALDYVSMEPKGLVDAILVLYRDALMEDKRRGKRENVSPVQKNSEGNCLV